nr:MAG TPA: hypothetical protein [Caudoviricetes sp.]
MKSIRRWKLGEVCLILFFFILASFLFNRYY